MLRGRKSQFLKKRETSPNDFEVEFRLENKVIKFSFKVETFQLNKSKKASKDVIFLSMRNPSGRLSKSEIRFQKLVKLFNFPSFFHRF